MSSEGRASLGGRAAPAAGIVASAMRLIWLLPGAVVVAGASLPALAGTGGDPRDQPYLSTIVNQALETERTKVEIPWSNPETGNRGTLVIDRTWYRDPQSPCRDYRWTLERAGHPTETISGTGCRIGPAVWRLDEGASASASPDPSAPSPAPASSPAKPDPSAAAPASAPASASASAPPPAPTARATKAQSARKGSTPASKPAAPAASASKPAAPAASGSEPASLPGYTLPSKTAM